MFVNRYPTFADALRDLDDALSMVHLWATLSPSQKVHASRVRNSKRLAKEFQHYIIVSHSLRKVFLSIKGIYYQAEVQGQALTWLVPYRFSNYVHHLTCNSLPRKQKTDFIIVVLIFIWCTKSRVYQKM